MFTLVISVFEAVYCKEPKKCGGIWIQNLNISSEIYYKCGFSFTNIDYMDVQWLKESIQGM